MLIDSHAHIQGKEYAGERDAVIARAREAGVEKIIAVGGAGDMSSNTEAIALADSFPNVYATVGMHPHDAKDVGEDELRELRELDLSPQSGCGRRDGARLLLQSLTARRAAPSLHPFHSHGARYRFAYRRA